MAKKEVADKSVIQLQDDTKVTSIRMDKHLYSVCKKIISRDQITLGSFIHNALLTHIQVVYPDDYQASVSDSVETRRRMIELTAKHANNSCHSAQLVKTRGERAKKIKSGEISIPSNYFSDEQSSEQD